MKFRDPLEDEIKIIKKKVIPEEILYFVSCIFFDLLALSVVPMGIATIIRKKSIPFAILSIIVQLLILALAAFIFSLAIECIKKIICVNKGKIRVSDCTVENIKVSVSHKKRVVWATVKTPEGKNRKIRVRYGIKKKDTGKRAVIMRFESKKKYDDELIVIGEQE